MLGIFLEDVKKKYKLYLGHKVRMLNQRNRIDTLFSTVHRTKAIIVIDFKMTEVGARARLDITPAELQFTTETAQESPELKPIAFYELFKGKFLTTALTSLQVRAKFGAVKRTNKK
jgi:hypothetical protein